MTESKTQLWGLWGPFGGWCRFTVASGGDRLGYGSAGTLSEAEAGKQVFDGERREGDTSEHMVALFDHRREPVFSDAKPTPAQWRLLDIIRRLGTINTRELAPTYKATIKVLMCNGWYLHAVDGLGREAVPPMLLTAAGERAWRAGVRHGIPPEVKRGIVEAAEAVDDAIRQIDDVVFEGKGTSK